MTPKSLISYQLVSGIFERDPKSGGLERFEIVREHIAPGDLLARSSAPYYNGNDADQKITDDTIAAFKEAGIKHVISLNEHANAEDMKSALAAAGIAYTPLPVEDFQSPTADDFQQGWKGFVAHRDGTLVWCGFGHGRTGTMVSALQMFAMHERGETLAQTVDDYRKNHVEKPWQEAALDELQKLLNASAAKTETPTPTPTTTTAAATTPSAAGKPPGPKEMETALCAPADGTQNKYEMTEADCRIQVAQCVFELSSNPSADWDAVLGCMDNKFLPVGPSAAPPIFA